MNHILFMFMKSRSKKYLAYTIIGVLMSFAIYFCSKKYKVSKTVSNTIGMRIDICSDSLFSQKKIPRILILVVDTGECTTCSMQVYDWYIHKLDLEEHNLSCDILYVLNDSLNLSKEIESLLGYYKLHYIKNANCFIDRNESIVHLV